MIKPTPNAYLVLTVFSGVLLAFTASLVKAQDISATITSVDGPSGTPTSPHFVIDSDGSNPDPGYDRDTFAASFEVDFQWQGGSGSGSDVFRAQVQLVGPDGPVVLSNGATSLTSSNQSISLASNFPTTSRTFNLEPAPGVDLGAGDEYVLRYRIQRRFVRSQDPFGNPVYGWLTADGPEDSDPFTVVHFTDDPGEPGARNIRGYLSDDPTWLKTHLIETSTSFVGPVFRVSVPYRQWRYDLDGESELTELKFTVEMNDDQGSPVPLLDDGVDTVSFTRPEFNDGSPKTPARRTGTRIINFAPAIQLDAVNRTYQVRIRFEHLEIPSSNTYQNNGTSGDSTSEKLLHFNGNLLFGSGGNTVNALIRAISNTPPAGFTGPTYVNSILNVTNGEIPGFEDYSFGDGNALNVRLLSNGNAVVTGGSQVVEVAGGGDVEADFNGIQVRYPETVLSSGGAIADETVVQLPQGLSYTPNRAAARGRFFPDFLIPGSRQLNGELRHSGTLTQATTSNAWVFDESRTLLYQASQFVLTQSGELRFDSPQAEWAHTEA